MILNVQTVYLKTADYVSFTVNIAKSFDFVICWNDLLTT